jgi:glutamine amidotransferase
LHRSKYGNFNCIFSDGEFLFFYFDKNGYNGLSFVRRQAPFSSVRLEDEDFEINLSEEKALKIKQKNIQNH